MQSQDNQRRRRNKTVSSYDDHDNQLTMMDLTTTKTIDVDEKVPPSWSESLPGSKFTISSNKEITTEEKPHKCRHQSKSTFSNDSSLIDEHNKLEEHSTIWSTYLMVLSNKCSIVVKSLILCGCLLSNACKILAGKRNDGMTKMMRRNYCKKSSNNSLLISIMLPFLLVFLLPSFKLETNQNNNNSNVLIIPSQTTTTTTTTLSTEDDYLKQTVFNAQQTTSIDTHTTLPIMSELLLSLARFPFDRLRLQSLGSFVKFVEAKEINMNHNNIIYRPNDLQEEETHMLIMAPAEHRSSFLAPNHGAQYQQISRSNQRGGQLNDHSGYQSGSIEPGLQMGAPLPPLPQAQPPQLQNQADLHNGGSDYANGPLGGESSGVGGDGSQGVGSVEGGPESGGGGGGQGGSLASGSSSSGLQTRGDLPVVRALNVKCEKNHMTVNIVFDRPFYGMVFSKGHYNDQKCVHLPANSGQTSVNFDIHLGKCGMSSSDAVATGGNQLQQANGGGQQQQQPNGLYIENVIIIQYDPQVQEIYDQARKLRCTWYDYYEKSVTFRPYNVDMHDAVTANFLGDNIQCWMQIQVGKGPWSNEVAGIVKIGQTMTMVLAIKDDENRFDMLVRNCVAHDGKHQPIQLVDEYGCVARPKIMAKFQKVRNFGPAATVVSYAHFQAFKFPDSMSVHFQCVIQVCRYECPEPVCNGQSSGGESISGGSGPSALSGSGTDYAASGTELVASKEILPQNGGHSTIKMVTPGQHNSNTANLKVDETQGRVQVKLDTSMIAGAQQTQRQPHNGPLPPHLLHTATPGTVKEASNQGAAVAASAGPPFAIGRGGHTFMSSSFTGAANSKSASSGVSSATGGAIGSGRPIGGRGASVVPSNGMQSMHYSSPYPQIQRSGALAYVSTNRLGDLPLDGDGNTSSITNNDGPSFDADSSKPLVSLFGSPRALLSTPNVSSSTSILTKHPALNHRYRRSINVNHTATATTTTEPKVSAKNARDLSGDSTAIKTQKTIQVVSPDDVAFSLLSDESLEPLTISGPLSGVSSRSRFYKPGEDLSTICFSATRLMSAILITLILVATSIVIVTFVIVRQRSIKRLEDSKLSPIYESSDSPAMSIQDHHHNHNHNHHQHQHHNQDQSSRQQATSKNYLTTPTTTNTCELYDEDSVAEIMSRRQREEIQQRNNYLARLYSQFSPATYWR